MINITELRPPFKHSGLSSFKVSFQYNPVLVQAMHTVPNAV